MNVRYTKEMLEEAVAKSKSFAEVSRHLDVKPNTGGQTYLTKKIKSYSIDTAHFTGQGWSKGKVIGAKFPLEYYFQGNAKISSWRLKLRLFAEGYFEKICSSCKLSEWLGEEIPLELDHIDGNKSNNKIENLRILCPNCHAKTDTYRTKNWKKNKTAV